MVKLYEKGGLSMRACIYPCKVDAAIDIPPSKSISHRAIIAASLSDGISHIENIAYSKDISATINAVRSIGANVTELGNAVVIEGTGKDFVGTDFMVDCCESGSTLRFLIPLFSLMGTSVVFNGSKRLFERPQSVYEKIFESQGLTFIKSSDSIEINGSVKSGVYNLDGDVSSQFITGLLLALPLLEENSVIKIKPPLESRSYIDLTLQVMSEFGVDASFVDDVTIKVRGKQSYRACDFCVEGDYSQMAFFAVLGCINSRMSCNKMRSDSKQGDKEIIDILTRFNGKIETAQEGYTFSHGELMASDIDLSDCPDLGPILAVLSAFSNGRVTIFNAGRLRIKESDRIESMETELKKLGVNISSTKDSIIISGRQPMTRPITVFAHNDHRIAMGLAVFAVCAEYPVVIEGAECVEKSYPDFFDDLLKIGVKVEIFS